MAVDEAIGRADQTQVGGTEMANGEAAATLLERLSAELAAAVETAGRSIVTVHGRARLPASGVVWGEGELMVTAAHVLERRGEIRIGLPEGGSTTGRLVALDPGSDVAVLRLATRAEPAALATRLPAPGGLVLALGRPSEGPPLATFGTVSAAGAGAWRTAVGGVVEGYLRADVALLPGFSGGALVDPAGRVLGLLSSHLAGPDAVALPSPALSSIVAGLLANGTPRRGYLGVSSQVVELQGALRQGLQLTQTTGLMLLGVEATSAAERAGLLPGDILLSLDGRAIVDGEALVMALGPASVGTALEAELVRGGARRRLSVTPAERPS